MNLFIFITFFGGKKLSSSEQDDNVTKYINEKPIKYARVFLKFIVEMFKVGAS